VKNTAHNSPETSFLRQVNILIKQKQQWLNIRTKVSRQARDPQLLQNIHKELYCVSLRNTIQSITKCIKNANQFVLR